MLLNLTMELMLWHGHKGVAHWRSGNDIDHSRPCTAFDKDGLLRRVVGMVENK